MKDQLSKLDDGSNSRQKIGQLTEDEKLKSERKSRRSKKSGSNAIDGEQDSDEDDDSEIELPSSDDDNDDGGKNGSDLDDDEVDEFGNKSRSRKDGSSRKSYMFSLSGARHDGASGKGATSRH